MEPDLSDYSELQAGEKNESTLAYFLMTVIGVGYLFPISAIWAAFDYWKVLFPEANVEFAVTNVYQVGSIITVAVLSVLPAMRMAPRILGGFFGQFATLLVILSFRWLTLSSCQLYALLITVVVLCSIATGYLDSALLSLCSQYPPKMQQYLQIGLGMGTMITVLYRDLTKWFGDGNIPDASTAFFGIALCTVLICVWCYRWLIALPISEHVQADELVSPVPMSYMSPVSLGAPTWTTSGRSLGEIPTSCLHTFNGPHSSLHSSDANFKMVWALVWWNQLTIFLHFFLTTLGYPGLITSIPCRQMHAFAREHWFQTLLLTMFTFADIVGRFCTHFRCGISHASIHWTLCGRSLALPLLLFCAVSPLTSDLLSFGVVGAFGFLNGYCNSLALIVVNEIPGLSDAQRKTCGRISACSVNGGLCVGSLVAAAIASVLKLGTS